MTCYDIIFPMALGPLTYICPDSLADRIEPGMLVAAPLRKRVATGIVLRKNETPPAAPLKELIEILGTSPVLGRPMMRLLLWISEYYIASEGLTLKQTVPAEVFEKTKLHKQKRQQAEAQLEFEPVPGEALQILAALQERKFRPFLYYAHTMIQEYSLVRGLCEEARNLVIVVPEISQAEMLFQSLHAEFGDRVCVLHSWMSKGRRSAYIDGIIAETHDIVIGGRHALFAPMKRVSCVAVLHEHSSFYKMEEGIRYHLRDVAVKKASLEKAAVVLSSITPSADSLYNAWSGKYLLVRPPSTLPRPRITIVDLRFAKKASPGISRTAVNIAGSRLKVDKNVMFSVNRKGYASLLCRECENTESCPDCNVSMVLHKEGLMLRCHYCGRATPVPQQCTRCRSLQLEMIGSGTERVQEEIEKLLGTKAIRFDRDSIKTRAEMADIFRTISGTRPNLIVGTRLLTTHLGSGHRFSLAVVLNIDASMNFPDFRASEKAYAELSSILDHVEPDGDLLVQTRTPASPMLRSFKADDYPSFVKEELEMRKALSFPPFMRMAAITVSGNTAPAEKIAEGIRKATPAIEVLGPVPSQDRRGRPQMSVFLKSPDRRALNRAARAVADLYGRDRQSRISIDVDPV